MCQHCEAKQSYAKLLAAKILLALKEQHAAGNQISGPKAVQGAITEDLAEVAEGVMYLVTIGIVELGLVEQPTPFEEASAAAEDLAVAESKKGYGNGKN